MKKKKIPVKNYVIAFFTLLIVVIVVLYAKKTYEINRANKLSQSVLSRVVGEAKYNEIDNVLAEKTDDYFIYISYVNNEDIYNLENKLKKVVSDYELQDNFYYINVTEELGNNNFISELNNQFNLKLTSVNDLPIILYYQAGNLKTIITSKAKLITDSNFKDLLISNGYQKK
ncbi:MAG TPA: hypothetical protein PLX66_03495 [Bacilli bacterium]|nr:hypothetical protein [Bacilli bacterium]